MMATEPHRGAQFRRLGPLLLVLAGVVVTAGCGEKPKPAATAKQLDQAFTATAAAAQPAQPAQAAAPATPQPQPDEAAAFAHAAANAMRAGDYDGAATALGSLRQQKGLNADQKRAVHKSYADLYADLSLRAARGDAQAKAALEKLKQAQDRR